jgi:hypothetical protein
MRPPHTFAAQQALLANHAADKRPDFRQLSIAQNVHQLESSPDMFVKLHAVSQVQKAELHDAARQTWNFEKQRRQFEAKPRASDGAIGLAGGAARSGPSKPEKLNLTQIPNFKSVRLPGAAGSNLAIPKTYTPPKMNTPGSVSSAPSNSGSGGSIAIRPNKVERRREDKEKAPALTPLAKPAVQTSTPPAKQQVQSFTPPAKPQATTATPSRPPVQNTAPVGGRNGGGGGWTAAGSPPPSHPQPTVNSNPAGRSDNHSDDNRGHDKNKDKRGG